MFQPGALPTNVVCLTEVVTADDLRDDEEYQDIMVDMQEEAEKFGMYMLRCHVSFLWILSIDILSLILCFKATFQNLHFCYEEAAFV